jgi:DNA polymerase V
MSPRGGKRTGAGRPSGSGKYLEKTQAIRVPTSLVGQIKRYAQVKGYQIPLYGCRVAAGFPSPADDYLEGALDLNEHLIEHPAATFFVRVSGYSMINAGIHPGDILIVDRSLEAVHNKIIVVALDNELTVKRLYKKNSLLRLMPENDEFSPIEIQQEDQLHVWGVVTNVIHPV